MIKACIFDLDGTLLNTLDTIAYFGNLALHHFGIAPIPTDEYKILVGNGSKVLVERMLKFQNADIGKCDEIHGWYKEKYDNDFLHLTSVYDGIVSMLEELKKMGIKTAILSNKDDSTTKKVAKIMLREGLIDICMGAMNGRPLKPDPFSLIEIVEGFGVSKNECLYIGDTATDIETAKNAGICSVGVLWGFRTEAELKNAGANIIVSHPSEIIDEIKNKSF